MTRSPTPVFEVEAQHPVLFVFVGTTPMQHGNTVTNEHHTTQRGTSHVNVRTQIVLIGIARPLTSHCLARQVASDRHTGSVCSRELTWKSGEINDTPERGGVDGTRHDSRWWVCASIAEAHRRPR